MAMNTRATHTSALDAIKSQPQAFVVGDPLTFTNRVQIGNWALKQRLPTTYAIREFVTAGGQMSFGTNLPSFFRRAAELSDRILRGASPVDIPVEQPTKFDLVINLKTAKALGLEVAANAARSRRRSDRIVGPTSVHGTQRRFWMSAPTSAGGE